MSKTTFATVANVTNRKTVIMYGVYDNRQRLLSLTQDQIRLMEWLKNEGIDLCGWDWQVVENIEIETI